jgi:vitamin B12 transporter
LFKFYSLLLLFLIGSSLALIAQELPKDTIFSEKEIVIYGNRLEEFDAGVKVVTSDSSAKDKYRHNNLTTYLEENSNIYLKSYGLGSLSTTSFRGASASQTSVLWNGFNIQSPMNGTLDLALIPVSLVDQVKVQFGGCGALWGSGSISGSLYLDNKPYYGKGLSLRYGAGYGSFRTLSQLASVSYSRKKWIISVKGFFNEAKNDFPYVNTAQFGEPKQKQTNASYAQYGYLMDHYFKLSKRDQLSIRFWQQYSHREIPPTMLTNVSDAVQKDWFIRVSSEWQHSRRRTMYNVRVAYFDEKLLYQELSKSIDSYSNSICQISEAETKIKIIKRGLLNIGLNNTYSTANVDAYQGIPYQNRSSLFSSVKYTGKNDGWKVNLGARKEIIAGSRYNDLYEVPIMPFAGADIQLRNKITLKSNVSRNYRLPTFNDLYWTPGGNPDLQPEQGWSEELGLHFIHQDKKCRGDSCTPSGRKIAAIGFSSTVFNRNIDNWIMWVPSGNYWVPMNILKVWSRGIESTGELTLNLTPFLVKTGVRYDYVLSTNEKVPVGSENELHKQLIYVPIHKTSMNLGVWYRGYSVNYIHHYTSWVFTQADNQNYIDPYWLGNLVLSKTYPFRKKVLMNLTFKINNIWDSQYQVIAYRAMPGRNFEVGISIQYH